MNTPAPLPAAALRQRCDPASLGFASTAELEPLERPPGQARAIEALEFGVGIRRSGYNLFVLGPPGAGKTRTLMTVLGEHAGREPVPPDWCYVNAFGQPHRPKAIRLEAGRGARFRDDMDALVDELRAAIPAAFESDDYRSRKEAIEQEFAEAQEGLFNALGRKARDKGVALIHTPTGLALAPMRDDQVLTPKQFSELPEEERKRFASDLEALQGELQQIIRQIPRRQAEQRQRLRELDREVTRFAVEHLIEAVAARYQEVPAVLAHLEAVRQDVLAHAELFLGDGTPALPGLPAPERRDGVFKRYRVNLLVDNSDSQGAPVVEEDLPSHARLLGRVEHLSQLGALVTDFTLVKAGALHRALGGYLVLDARRLLLQPFAWDGLKRVLRSRQVRIESLADQLGLVSTVSLEPEPLPWEGKVVLVGERLLYYLLSALDPEFGDLFKVPVDFDDRMERDAEGTGQLARLVASVVRDEELLPLDAPGAARVVEEISRLSGDGTRLSTRIADLVDLLRETDHWARGAGRASMAAEDVQQAVDARVRRADRVRSRLQEEICRGTILIDVTGSRVGQVNGLSVTELGGYAFGRPTRISARVRPGKGEVLDIEREVELGGPTHSKGVLILTGLLGGRYATRRPLSLSASLVFEQSYGGVDGDSASLAELLALLSALAEVPLSQGRAVTGSVDQHGQVQAIGAVNEKIEGFFDVCKALGLDGSQGVVIPAANVPHLMLRPDVVAAAEAGRFSVWPVRHVDEALELLTGQPAGERDPQGAFPEGSVNARVEEALLSLAERVASFVEEGRALAEPLPARGGAAAGADDGRGRRSAPP